MPFQSFISKTLREKKSANLYRHRKTVERVDGEHVFLQGEQFPLVNFCSNDYLGLSQHPRVINAMQSAASQYGAGSGASHLVSGHSELHHHCEQALADLTGREAALLFSTGYMANMGVINALLDKHDCVFQDKLNHASLIDGAQLSRAKLIRFKHNDTAQLERLLQESDAKKKLVAVDGVFSMDGDVAPLKELASICKRNNAWLMADDAHGLGVMGKNGAGVLNALHLSQNDVPILMGTLGKAMGTFGAFVAGSKELIDALIQLCRTYIYTTALPPALAAATLESIQLIQTEPWRQLHLMQLIDRFKTLCAQNDIPLMPSNSAIQPILIGDEQEALNVSRQLQHHGFWVTAIRPPTVPIGTSRLRVTLSAAHKEEQIEKLVEVIAKLLKGTLK